MKLNKLTSAVSVSLLAVALTACGGSDNGDEGPILTPTPSATPAPTPSVTPTPTPAAGSTAAELTAALTAAGLTNANAAALIAANPGLTVGSAQYTSLLAQKLAEQNAAANNTGTNTAVSPTVVKANPHINGVDTNKFATVTANQYTRQPGSNFDRSANSREGLTGGLGAIGTDDPTTQGNPYLSNYVLGVEVIGGNVVAIDSTGELVVRDTSVTSGSNVGQGRLLISEKSPYVDQSGARYTKVGYNDGNQEYNYYFAPAAAAGNTEFYNLQQVNRAGAAALATAANDAARVVLAANPATNGGAVATDVIAGQEGAGNPTIYTLQQINQNNVRVSTTNDVETALSLVRSTATAPLGRDGNGKALATVGGGDYAAGGGATSGLLVYNANSIAVGNADGAKLGYKLPVYGVEENIYDADGNALNAVDTAQAAADSTTNNANRSLNDSFLAKEVVQYSAADITGGQVNRRLYVEVFKSGNDTIAGATSPGDIITADSDDTSQRHLANPVANAHETRIFGKNYNSYESGAVGTQKTANTYVGRYDSKSQMSNIGTSVLQYVQYGRLTNNIDVLADKSTATKPIVYRQFQQHGADNSVDTYFYRGTHHTSLDEMKALQARGGTIQYYGHALTYGVGPKAVDEAVAKTLPTAYGLGSTEATIGNFVQAKYDVAKARVDGTVYNFINKNLNANTIANRYFTKQDLITFGGDVYGNTVTGTATKVGSSDQGTFTGSFFGSSANELGGSITSITRSAGYDTPKWGAVFGATKGSAVENFNVIEQGQ